MRRNVRLKTCVAALAMLVMPLALSAQTDGFFTSDNDGGNRGNEPYPYSVGVLMDDFGDTSTPEAPVGGGLLIMVAAGAGYLALKRKEEK